MTSRETTGLFPRLGETPVFGEPSRSISDWAMLFAFGAVQWPWLVRSLHGGTLEQKRALLDRLNLPGDALPNLGSWKADTGLLSFLADHVLTHQPKVVVEFGSGASTLILARALRCAGGGSLISFDQHRDFVDRTRRWLAEHGLDADLRAVPLRAPPDGWPGLWYDHGPLPATIDLLVIDGPPWTIHPMTRGSAETLFSHIPQGGMVVLDDGARPGERFIARRWRRDWPEFDFRLLRNGSKGTLVGTRKS